MDRGRITAFVIGTILVLVSIGLMGAGGTALWADLMQRDAAGYVMTGVHGFSTSGSALVTDPVELDSPGVGWLYSSVVPGGTPASAPGTQDFWVASATGTGPQTLTWDAANGSWSVVMMNADGRPGLDVGADLGATFPALLGIAVGSLVLGGVILLGGALLIAGAIRRRRASRVVTV